jgi:hypothetical protein
MSQRALLVIDVFISALISTCGLVLICLAPVIAVNFPDAFIGIIMMIGIYGCGFVCIYVGAELCCLGRTIY